MITVLYQPSAWLAQQACQLPSHVVIDSCACNPTHLHSMSPMFTMKQPGSGSTPRHVAPSVQICGRATVMEACLCCAALPS